MTAWFLYAVAARFLWACANLADQAISRHFGEGRIWSVIIFQDALILPSLAGMLVVFGLPEIHSPAALIWVALGVLFNLGGIYPYYRALQLTDARNVAPLFELTPVFVMLYGLLFFGETLTPTELAGAALIAVAGFFFAWDFRRGHIDIKPLILMALSAALYGFHQFTLRGATVTEKPEDVLILISTGVFLSSAAISVLNHRALIQAIEKIKEGGFALYAAGTACEITTRLAALAIITAYALAPTAGHVAALSGVQPFFVFALAFGLSFVWPRHFQRIHLDRDLAIKMVLLCVMVGGIILLNG